MAPAFSPTSVHIAEYGCITALGDAASTYRALQSGQRALRLHPVLGNDGGDLVPLALCAERSLDESAPPSWLPYVRTLLGSIADASPWGSARRPVFLTSSNFGVGSLYAYRRTKNPNHLLYGTPNHCVEWLRSEMGWGDHVTTFSHACVSAHLGILQASRVLAASLADEALVFTFDFLSPFVAGGFHALKILNAEFPAPYEDRPSGSIGLGDGAGFVVLSRDRGDFRIDAQCVYNEMHHFTANQTDGAGFAQCYDEIARQCQGRRVWIKGHGTGTIEAGKLEAQASQKAFPNAPLVSWKGSLGHSLGSCGIVELAVAAEALQAGSTPGTIGSSAPGFAANVAHAPFGNQMFDGVVCTSNAFGGAHAALLLSRD